MGRHRLVILQNQNLAFTDELLCLLADAGINSLPTTFATTDVHSSLTTRLPLQHKMLGEKIHALMDKNDRRTLFDHFGELTHNAFSVNQGDALFPSGECNATSDRQQASLVDGSNGQDESQRMGTINDDAATPSTIAHTYARLCAARTPPAQAKGPARAGAKKAKQLEKLQSTGPTLDPEEATAFRALSARANYLAQDRPDIAFATKELCREFSCPTRRSYEKLKRAGRYLAGNHRLVYEYKWLAEIPDSIDVYVDTDLAGCKDTRRSTSGGVAMMGSHCVKHWSKTQSTVSLSSGESELHGICAGVAQAIGLQSICKDLGFTYKLRVFSDATAAIGIARRRGMGTIRHLDCSDLWVQEKIRNGVVDLQKVLGSQNPADAFTKHVDKATLHMAMGKIGMRMMEGRAKCAPDTLGLH